MVKDLSLILLFLIPVVLSSSSSSSTWNHHHAPVQAYSRQGIQGVEQTKGKREIERELASCYSRGIWDRRTLMEDRPAETTETTHYLPTQFAPIGHYWAISRLLVYLSLRVLHACQIAPFFDCLCQIDLVERYLHLANLIMLRESVVRLIAYTKVPCVFDKMEKEMRVVTN